MTKFFGLLLLLFCAQLAASDLVKHVVPSDGHPMTLWEKSPTDPKAQILLLHGLTWSSLPDFDLQVEGEDLSFMDGLNALGYSVYALDARGYGATPRDASGWLTPDRAARDVSNVLAWLRERSAKEVHLFGWSYGAMVAPLVMQRAPEDADTLILFGYPFSLERYSVFEKVVHPAVAPAQANTAENAASDFIVPGSISQQAIDTYVEASLRADPVRADIRNTYEWAELNPARIKTPTLLITGEFDPLVPIAQQAEFFRDLGTADKWFVILPGGDHAALLETPRERMLHAMDSFMQSLE
jgi:pimeloyl-ACP methyl ester carboxylesterase